LNSHDNSDQENVEDGRQQEDAEQESPRLFHGVAGDSHNVFDTAHANGRSSCNIGRTTLGFGRLNSHDNSDQVNVVEE